METKIIKMIRFATIAHSGQIRKYTGTPYIYHPIRVACKYAMRDDATEAGFCACIGHDLIEDTNISVNTLVSEFGREVADLVYGLTNPSKGSTLSRAERKKWDREHLAEQCQLVKVIKLIDRIDNLNEMSLAESGFIWKYCKESRLLAEVLKDADLELYNELMSAIERLELSCS